MLRLFVAAQFADRAGKNVERAHRQRVLGAERFLANRQRSSEEGLGRAWIATPVKVAAHHRHGQGDVGVVGAERLLLDRNRPPCQRFGALDVALHEHDTRKVRQSLRGLRMFAAEVSLANLDQAIGERAQCLCCVGVEVVEKLGVEPAHIGLRV